MLPIGTLIIIMLLHNSCFLPFYFILIIIVFNIRKEIFFSIGNYFYSYAYILKGDEKISEENDSLAYFLQ